LEDSSRTVDWTQNRLDSVLEEARNVDKEADNKDGCDGPARAAQINERLDKKRPRDGHITSHSHRDRQPCMLDD